MIQDSLGSRMKQYENAFRFYLPKRLPVIIRIDGTHFHTYTRGMNKPFDEELSNAFWETAKFLAQNIMGCKLIYHQSDELSLLLINYERLTSESWFDNNLQKLASVSASLATAKFNEIMFLKTGKLATFDSRAWVLPMNEVVNYFMWRQQDAMKNSVSMVAQAHFKHRELQGLNKSQLQDKLIQEKGINWNNLPVWQKRGACIVKREYEKGDVIRRKWEVDFETPVFSEDRLYIERHIYVQNQQNETEDLVKQLKEAKWIINDLQERLKEERKNSFSF